MSHLPTYKNQSAGLVDIFKITANIDSNHRSCIAFCKVCSGKFSRNTPYLHVRHDKTMRFSSPTQFMAKDREDRDVFLADSGYVLQMAQMDFKHIRFHFTSEF